jgi:hypothetical protein
MNNSCYSCGMPLTGEEGAKSRGNYCRYCADEQGNLLPAEQVKQGIAQWLQGWAPQGNKADFGKRAESYMKAMPAWAEE